MLVEYLSKRIVPVCVTLLLSACGGSGGGADAGGATGHSPPPPVIPDHAPAVPVVVYTGRRGPVDLDEANAGAMADAMIVSFLAALPLVENIGFPHNLSETIDETIHGDGGGTARLTGRINSDETGWLSSEMTDFSENGVIRNGLDIIEWLGPQEERRSFHDFQISTANFGAVSFDGYIELRRPADRVKTISGTMLYSDFNRGLKVYAEGFEITDDTSGTHRKLSASGLVFDARYGSVNMVFEAPWQIPVNSNFPHFGGPVLGYGKDDRFLRMTSITGTEVSLEFVEAGEQETTRAARLPWNVSFEDETTSPMKSMPEASGGQSRYYAPGAVVVLDARFSRHLQNALLKFEWELWFRPPGSDAELSALNTLRPTLYLDKPGRYLIRLSASDGARTAHDFIVLTADPAVYSSFPPLNIQFPPDVEVNAGKTVTVSKEMYSPQSFNDPSPQVGISYLSTGNSLVKTDSMIGAEIFQAMKPGVNLLSLYRGNSSVIDLMLVAVDTPLNYAPAVWFETPNAVESIAVMDINGDGRDDIVTAQERFDSNPSVEIHYSEAPNSIEEPVALSGGNGLSVALGDVTGDGRPDIIASNRTGPDLFVQQSGNTFAPAINLGGVGCSDVGGCPILIGDINGDNRNDIVATTEIQFVNFFLQESDGTMAAAVQIDMGINAEFNIDMGDLNGDGINDVAVAIADTPPGNIAVIYGQSTGGPGAPVMLGPAFDAHEVPGIAVGDLDGDGRDDLVFSDSPRFGTSTIFVYLQNESGQLIAHQEIAAESDVIDLMLHDFDRDGRVDIGKYDSAGGTGVHYQDDDGQFGSQRRELYGERARPLAIGDINADGLIDIVYYAYRSIGIVFGVERHEL